MDSTQWQRTTSIYKLHNSLHRKFDLLSNMEPADDISPVHSCREAMRLVPFYTQIKLCKYVSLSIFGGPGSSSGKALGYGLGRPKFDPGCRKGGDFSSLHVQTGPGVNSTSYKMSTRGKDGRA